MSWFKSLFGGTRSDAAKEVPKSEGGTPKLPHKDIAPTDTQPFKHISKPAEREPPAEEKESQKSDPRPPELMGKLDKVPNQNTPAGQMDFLTNGTEQQKESLDTIISRGLEFDKNGKKDEAIAEFSRAVECYPTETLPYEYRAQMYAMRRDGGRVQKDLEQCVLIGVMPSKGTLDFVARKLGRPVDLDRLRIVLETISPHPFYWIDFSSTDAALACLNATSFARLGNNVLRSPPGVYFHVSYHPEDNTATLMIGGELVTLQQMTELYTLAMQHKGKFVKAHLRKKTATEDWSELFNSLLQTRVGPNDQLELAAK